MRRINLSFLYRVSDTEDVNLYFGTLAAGNVLCMAAKTAGKGRWLQNPPKAWTIREDQEGTSRRDQPKHYHCHHRRGDEIVITVDGYGSHDTVSGDPIPKRLGEYLEKELEIPVLKVGGKHVIKLETCFPIMSDSQRNLVTSSLEAFLNHWVVETKRYDLGPEEPLVRSR